MKRILSAILGSAMICAIAGPAEAFTSRASRSVAVGSAGVTEATTLDPVTTVTQNTADVAAALTFGTAGNDFRDSGEALRINVTTNVAANRLIIYTANLSGAAVPQFCANTALGVDGGGLVGTPTAGFPLACQLTVPMVWGIADTNVDYAFAPRPLPGIGATNGVFITDRAHVRTFTTDSALDNLATKFCSVTATHAVPPTNTAGDGLYPQYFGDAGTDLDICRVSDSTKVVEAEELSKNISVLAFGFAGNVGLAANLATASTADTIPVTSPFYVPMAADFRQAAGGVTYSTNTLTVELISQ